MDKIEKIKHKGILRVICPECGYTMPVFYDKQAESQGVFVPCKGRGCKTFFEVKIKNGKQVR